MLVIIRLSGTCWVSWAGSQSKRSCRASWLACGQIQWTAQEPDSRSGCKTWRLVLQPVPLFKCPITFVCVSHVLPGEPPSAPSPSKQKAADMTQVGQQRHLFWGCSSQNEENSASLCTHTRVCRLHDGRTCVTSDGCISHTVSD